MTKQFTKTLLKYQKEITRELEKFFDQKIRGTRTPFEKKTLRWLKEFSLRPAKRIRAILFIRGYFLAGGKNKKAILKTSIFTELIHNFLLIHDDIIDNDKMRRGKKTLHCLYGKNMATVLGDTTSALGYEVLSSSDFSLNYRMKALEKLNQTLYFTCFGQMLELWLREKKKFTDKDILEIYTKKTAFYTLIAPLQTGALLAGANKSFLKKIKNFALPLGIAFQIRDDLQDGDIENVFRSDKEKYRKMLEKFVKQAKNNLNSEKAFPKKEKEFLSSLADYTKLI